MDTKKATICVIAAGALWGCISLFVRALNAAGLSAIDISCVRMVVGVACMLLVLLAVDRDALRIRVRDLWLFAGTGIVSVTFFNWCYFTCIELSEVSIAVVLLYTSPVFVMLMSALFFKERITARKLVALACTFAGCVLVAGVVGTGVQIGPLALGMGVASGFFYALYSVFSRVALRRYDPLTITFYTFAMGSVACLLLADPPAIAGTLAANPQVIWLCVGIGIMCTVFPYILYTIGLRGMETGRAAILATVEPLVGAIIGIFVFAESTDLAKLAGMALILAAVLVLNTGQKHRGSADAS
ncbi:MAG: DMT family transporter [Coriobacteriaceae bacterium]|nr:DMT family transporter [Coriobacteriaceae bacterium]